MTRVAIIPARGGSVRIQRKNVRDFMGKPMMQWPIEAAKASGLFDRIIVSTDDHEIAGFAWFMDCVLHKRKPDDGSTGTQELAARVLEAWPDVDEACVIYPCSPMLRPSHLRAGHSLWRRGGMPFARTVMRDGSDAGCFYWGTGEAFVSRLPLEGNTNDITMEEHRFIDINTPEDWAKAESMFNALRRAP